MTPHTILLLTKDDLRQESLDKEYKQIKLHDFRFCYDCINLYPVIMYVEDMGTKILHNRFGVVGEVEFEKNF